jgi:tRNA(fMet)-specific endonuclease VapC
MSKSRCNQKRAGKPIPTNDIWIAALCHHSSYPLLTRDRHSDLAPGIRRIAW